MDDCCRRRCTSLTFTHTPPFLSVSEQSFGASEAVLLPYGYRAASLFNPKPCIHSTLPFSLDLICSRKPKNSKTLRNFSFAKSMPLKRLKAQENPKSAEAEYCTITPWLSKRRSSRSECRRTRGASFRPRRRRRSGEGEVQ